MWQLTSADRFIYFQPQPDSDCWSMWQLTSADRFIYFQPQPDSDCWSMWQLTSADRFIYFQPQPDSDCWSMWQLTSDRFIYFQPQPDSLLEYVTTDIGRSIDLLSLKLGFLLLTCVGTCGASIIKIQDKVRGAFRKSVDLGWNDTTVSLRMWMGCMKPNSRASHIKMEGARFLALLKWHRGVIAPLELAPLKITRGALSNQNVKCFISHHSLSMQLHHSSWDGPFPLHFHFCWCWFCVCCGLTRVAQLVLGTNPPTHPACMSCQCHALLHGSFSQNCVVPALSTFLASSVLLLWPS